MTQVIHNIIKYQETVESYWKVKKLYCADIVAVFHTLDEAYSNSNDKTKDVEFKND